MKLKERTNLNDQLVLLGFVFLYFLLLLLLLTMIYLNVLFIFIFIYYIQSLFDFHFIDSFVLFLSNLYIYIYTSNIFFCIILHSLVQSFTKRVRRKNSGNENRKN